MSIRRRWAPSSSIRVRRNHPLARGLVFCAGAYSGWQDLLNGIQPTFPVTVEAGTDIGVGAATTASAFATYSGAATAHLDFTSAPFSVLWVAQAAPATGQYPLGLARSVYVSESVSQGWHTVLRSTDDTYPGPNFAHFANNATSLSASSAAGNGLITAGTTFNVLGTSSGSPSRKVYVNGVLRSTSTSVVPVAAGASVAMTIGSNNVSTNIQNCIWARELTAREATMLYDDPFCFLI